MYRDESQPQGGGRKRKARPSCTLVLRVSCCLMAPLLFDFHDIRARYVNKASTGSPSAAQW